MSFLCSRPTYICALQIPIDVIKFRNVLEAEDKVSTDKNLFYSAGMDSFEEIPWFVSLNN